MSTTRWPVPSFSRTHPAVTTTISGLTPSNVNNYEINAEPGSFAVTGTAATLAATRLFDAQPGTYAVTGTAATLAATLLFDAQPGSYTLTGVLATFEHAIPFDAQPGSYSITGADATLAADRLFDAQDGAYTITGADVTFVRSFDINAEPGSYTISGTDATLAAGRLFDAQDDSYSISGADATLEYSGPVAQPRNTALIVKAHTYKRLEQVSQTISGLTPTAAPNNYELDCQPGTYTITGVDATFTHNVPDVWDRIVSPNYAHSTPQIIYGSRIFGGVEVVEAAGYEINAEPGSYAITGTAATLPAARLFIAEPGSYTLTGTDATLARGLYVEAVPGSYTVSGVTAQLVWSGEAGGTARTRTLLGVGQ